MDKSADSGPAKKASSVECSNLKDLKSPGEEIERPGTSETAHEFGQFALLNAPCAASEASDRPNCMPGMRKEPEDTKTGGRALKTTKFVLQLSGPRQGGTNNSMWRQPQTFKFSKPPAQNTPPENPSYQKR